MPPDIESIVLYSDTCGGQNKNSNVIAMLMYVLKAHLTLKTIDHKFLIAGHTHMECDSDHALIERKSKRSPFPIYHPRDWQHLVRIASTQKNKFEVKAMTQSEFFDFTDLFKNFFKKRNWTWITNSSISDTLDGCGFQKMKILVTSPTKRPWIQIYHSKR